MTTLAEPTIETPEAPAEGDDSSTTNTIVAANLARFQAEGNVSMMGGWTN